MGCSGARKNAPGCTPWRVDTARLQQGQSELALAGKCEERLQRGAGAKAIAKELGHQRRPCDDKVPLTATQDEWDSE